jgi:CRISPR-associated protein Cmr6
VIVALEVPIGEGIRRALHSCAANGWLENVHPGLVLDKFPATYDPTNKVDWSKDVQRPTAEQVGRLCGSPPTDFPFANLLKRWKSVTAGGVVFSATTIGPLTLHLARASTLENAGICLHPLYGFTYLPGSGLKGMARAYAETMWQPTQVDPNKAWKTIEDVFGWAPGSDREKSWKPQDIPERGEADNAFVGSIVFHDAWPESWPQLIVDIVNNHHPDYYQADPDDNNHPPGDWEDPVPVYFLAVKRGTTFHFPLVKRRADVADGLLALARQWLLGALCHLGAGAKTAAGYGAFKPTDEEPPPMQSQSRAVFETTLELVTPAFLAGAGQDAEDCDLRSATLRGLLRWWWRTMHAGFLDVKTLRALEGAIWGDTHGGGAVRIVIEKRGGSEPRPYDKRSKMNFDANKKNSDYGIPGWDPKKTTQGLWYSSFGMDETSKGPRKQRFFLEPTASWHLRLVSRATRFCDNRNDAADAKRAISGKLIAAEQALSQATAALWLLSHFGAVGSKARKGFGSLAMSRLDGWNLELCSEAANELRSALQLPNEFDERRAHSASLEQMLGPVEVGFCWPHVWSVLDQAGFAYQAFAKNYRHRLEKKALGLPRQIGNPVKGKFNPTPPVTGNSRHSSPVHIHVERGDKVWLVRAIGFPAAHLPDLAASRKFLEAFLKDFGDELRRRAELPSSSSSPAQNAVSRTAPPSPANSARSRKVKVKFFGPHATLKNAFWVKETGKKRGLLKYGPPTVPLPAVDSEIEVYPTNDNPNSPEYRWDPPPRSNPPQGGPGGRRPRA